jgi:hypothetical protein
MAAHSAAARKRDASWVADPSGRYEYRFWDGAAWTAWVSDHDDLGVDLDTDPSKLAPSPVGRRGHPRSWLAITNAVLALTTSVVALIAVQSSRDTAGSGPAFSSQLGTTLGIEYTAMAAIAFALGALVVGTTDWIRNRLHGIPTTASLCAMSIGAIGLAIAITTLTQI